MVRKAFVKVVSETNVEGVVRPLSFVWEDGRIYPVDRILDVRRAASLKAGGMGIRYTCMVQGRQVHLFYEEPCWFIEAKEA